MKGKFKTSEHYLLNPPLSWCF